MREIYCIAKGLLLLMFLQLFVNHNVYAQSDAFFNSKKEKRFEIFDDTQAPPLPYSHGLIDNFSADTPVPIGGG